MRKQVSKKLNDVAMAMELFLAGQEWEGPQLIFFLSPLIQNSLQEFVNENSIQIGPPPKHSLWEHLSV